MLLQGFAQLVEQAGVLNRNDGLGGEIRDKLDLLIGEGANLLAKDADYSNELVISEHRHDDIGPNSAELRCIDPKTEEVLWSKEGFGYGSLLKADGKILAQTANGQLILASLSTKSYSELARARVLKSTAQALPALSNGRLYVRDEQMLKCREVGR